MGSERRHTREDSGLELDEDGRWFHDGVAVEHPRVAEAFHRGLERAPDGRYLLRFGGDWCYVRVKGAPLQVLAAAVDGPAGRVALTLSNGAVEPLDPRTLRLWEGILYCAASSGLVARFSRAAQVALGACVEEGAQGFSLRLGSLATPILEGPPGLGSPPDG